MQRSNFQSDDRSIATIMDAYIPWQLEAESEGPLSQLWTLRNAAHASLYLQADKEA